MLVFADDSTGVGSAGGARPSRRRPSRGDIRATVHRLVHSTTASAAGQADIQSQVFNTETDVDSPEAAFYMNVFVPLSLTNSLTY